jgi:hypothetical protein
LKGTINDLAIQNLKVSGLDQLKVAASGRIKNAMNPDNLYYDLKIAEVSSSSKTIYNLVPKNTIPKNITFFFLSLLQKTYGTYTISSLFLKFEGTLPCLIKRVGHFF